MNEEPAEVREMRRSLRARAEAAEARLREYEKADARFNVRQRRKSKRVERERDEYEEALRRIANEEHVVDGGTLRCYIRGDCECDQEIARAALAASGASAGGREAS